MADLGKINYESFCAAITGDPAGGGSQPWAEVAPQAQAAWQTAAEAVIAANDEPSGEPESESAGGE